jgi:hypothetical protein
MRAAVDPVTAWPGVSAITLVVHGTTGFLVPTYWDEDRACEGCDYPETHLGHSLQGLYTPRVEGGAPIPDQER